MGPSHFILYVRDQERASSFWRHALACEPALHVPGMTEFSLGQDAVLGLMPAAGIKSLLGDGLPDPEDADGIPRSEVYLVVTEPGSYHERALEAGARELSPLEPRGWGDSAAYSLDPDGHVIAFAERPAASEQTSSVARKMFELFQARDWDAASELLAEDVVVEWPHTSEVIRGRRNVIDLNRNYPEPWHIEVRRTAVCGTFEAVEADVSHPGGVATVASCCDVRNGLIVSAREYWVEAGAEQPPEWRSGMTDRLPAPTGLVQ